MEAVQGVAESTSAPLHAEVHSSLSGFEDALCIVQPEHGHAIIVQEQFLEGAVLGAPLCKRHDARLPQPVRSQVQRLERAIVAQHGSHHVPHLQPLHGEAHPAWSNV